MMRSPQPAAPRSSAPSRSPSGTQRRLSQLLDGFKTATLIVREGKHLATRHVSVLRVDEGGSVWLALEHDQRAHSLDLSTPVQVVCQSPNVHVTVSGEAKVVSDGSRPDVMLISLEPTSGEYWDEHGYSHATLWRRS